MTTELALFLTYVIGVVAMGQPALAAGGAVVVAALLAGRATLHRFSVDVLSQSELRDALIFCGAALVVLPLLPEQGTAWLPAVNPRRFWRLVVVLMGLQAAGHVALRAAGPRLGLALSGLVSGFVSSIATIAALGSKAREAHELSAACVSGALFSTVATVVLLSVVAATVNPDGLRVLGPSLIAGFAAALTVAVASLRRSSGRAVETMMRGRAFNLWYAIGFAMLLSAVTAATAYLAGRFGQRALPVAAAFTGFFDVHTASTSVLSIAAADELPRAEVLTAVLLAFTTNTMSKLVAAAGAGGLGYAARVTPGLILVALAMWAPLLWPAA